MVYEGRKIILCINKSSQYHNCMLTLFSLSRFGIICGRYSFWFEMLIPLMILHTVQTIITIDLLQHEKNLHKNIFLIWNRILHKDPSLIKKSKNTIRIFISRSNSNTLQFVKILISDVVNPALADVSSLAGEFSLDSDPSAFLVSLR